MQNDQQSIMNSLKNEGPKAWRAYLDPFEDGNTTPGLSMLVIFHYVAPLAKKQGSLDWAEVAVRAAELEARRSGGIESENARFWAMQLRSWFIGKMGSRSNHFVLDKEVILNWVIEGLTLSLQTAKDKAASLGERLAASKHSANPEDKQRVLEDLRLLSRCKHRLNVVKVLSDSGELPNNPILNEWLAIREQLP